MCWSRGLGVLGLLGLVGCWGSPEAPQIVLPLAHDGLRLPSAPVLPLEGKPQVTTARLRPEEPVLVLRVEVPEASDAVKVRVARAHEALTWYESRFVGAAGGRVRGPDGVELSVQPGALVDGAGAVVEGEVAVRWALIDGVDKLGAAPGNLATTIEGQEVPLQSFGMVQVSFHAGHQELALAIDADLSFPVTDGLHEGEQVGIYAYDPATGLWAEEGQGEVEEDRFAIRIDRSGWWNCDRPLAQRGCVRGTVEHEGWRLPEDTRAHLVGVEYMTRDVATPDAQGAFCLDGMPSVQARIEAYQVGPQCFALQSVFVTASAAGTSCFVDPGACTPVTLVPTPVACGAAQAALDAMGHQRQVGAAEELTRQIQTGPLTLRVPEDMPQATLRCGPRRVTLPVQAGTVTFPEVPLQGGCRVLLEDGSQGWLLDEAKGAQEYRCERRGKAVRCGDALLAAAP
jgi:hypothetical protein